MTYLVARSLGYTAVAATDPMKIGLGASFAGGRGRSGRVKRAAHGVVALFVAGGAVRAQSPGATEWPAVGAGGTRYSAAAEITSANVEDLRLAVGHAHGKLSKRGRFEATPTTSARHAVRVDSIG